MLDKAKHLGIFLDNITYLLGDGIMFTVLQKIIRQFLVFAFALTGKLTNLRDVCTAVIHFTRKNQFYMHRVYY